MLAAVWDMWKQNISINAVVQEKEMICWAAKWEGDEEVHGASTFYEGKDHMMTRLHDLLEEADVVVTYNGDRFDLPIINQEFLFLGIAPPKPYTSVDLIRTVKRRFNGSSNRLNWWLRMLGLAEKTETGGFDLWMGCLRGESESWDHMIVYNKDDVRRTEDLYRRIHPWIPNLPVAAPVVDDAGAAVPTCQCGSTHLQRRGYKATLSGMFYQQYQCMSCGRWHRARISDKSVPKNSVVHVGQV